LFGYAGTGKTELAREIGRMAHSPRFCAFTGKAAHVLHQRGCSPAQTIHSLIYRASYDEEFDRWTYTKRDPSELADVDLFIVDEGSMVPSLLAIDLLSFGKPVFVSADPAQLPPVEGRSTSLFMEAEPDVMLTEIHRQAAENPILRLADAIRRGEPVPRCGYRAGGVLEVSSQCADPDTYDATLVGANDTRQRQNCMARRRRGFRDDQPQVGETLVCLRNDYGVKDVVFNGSVWEVIAVAPDQPHGKRPVLRLDLKNEYGRTYVRVPAECFTQQRFEPYPDLQQFDFGYALTVHKAQGSEWPAVRLINEAKFFRAHARRWLYTGITRARERLTINEYCEVETAEALARVG
jgi:exodeoxyribonuclease-5